MSANDHVSVVRHVLELDRKCPKADARDQPCGSTVSYQSFVQLSAVALPSHSSCVILEGKTGHEAPRFHDDSRRLGRVSPLGRRAAEGDAGDWVPAQPFS